MDKVETEKILHFLHRMPMYLSDITKENIVSFMHGVDLGTSWKPYWTQLLSEFIETNYSISNGAKGWANQIEILAKNEDSSWQDTFKNSMLELINESNKITFTVELKEINAKYLKRETQPIK